MQLFVTDYCATLFAGANQLEQGEIDAVALVMTNIESCLSISRAGFDRVFTHAFGGGYYVTLRKNNKALSHAKIESLFRQAKEMVTDLNIDWNCCTDGREPSWNQYTALELCGVTMSLDDDFSQVCERVGKGERYDFLSLYGILSGGGCECLHDFPASVPSVEAVKSIVTALARKVELPVSYCV